MYHNYMLGDVSEALPHLMKQVLERGAETGTRNGTSKELTHVGVTLTRPWNREILVPERQANLAAQIAETMWVLAGRDDIQFLSHYLPRAADFSDDGTTWRGAYGPRLRRWKPKPAASMTAGDRTVDQLAEVVRILQADPLSRRAVMSIFDPGQDYADSKDIPCNNWLTFSSRLGKLDLHVGIRSNDLMWGWSGINAFEWSALQEIVAGLLGIQVGSIHFSITSLHLYAPYWAKAQRIADTAKDWGRSHVVDSPRFDIVGFEDKTVEGLDKIVAEWFEIERTIRDGDKAMAAVLVEEFREPMLQSWLRVIQWWWTGERGYLAPLDGTRLGYATHTAMQPPDRTTVHQVMGAIVNQVATGQYGPLDTSQQPEAEFHPVVVSPDGTTQTLKEFVEGKPGVHYCQECGASESSHWPGGSRYGQHEFTYTEEDTVANPGGFAESDFLRYAIATHNDKHAAYGDSWKRRGEMLGILANVARKVDRLGGAETSDETSADTAMDLMIYLAKYRTWLVDRTAGTSDLQSDDPTFANDRLRDLERYLSPSLNTAAPSNYTSNLESELRALFTDLEMIATKGLRPDTRAVVVDAMMERAYRLARYLWHQQPRLEGTDPMAEAGEYRGADAD